MYVNTKLVFTYVIYFYTFILDEINCLTALILLKEFLRINSFLWFLQELLKLWFLPIFYLNY